MPANAFRCVMLLLSIQAMAVRGQRFSLKQAPDPAGEAPVPRYGAAMQSFPDTNQVVLFGGRTETSALSDTWIFNPNSNVWEKVNGIGPSPRFNSLGVGIDFGGSTGKQMYIVGGRTIEAPLKSSFMWVFDLSLRKWAEVMVKKSTNVSVSIEHVIGRTDAVGGATENKNILVSHGKNSDSFLSDAYLVTFANKTQAVIHSEVYGASRSFTVGDPRALSAAAFVMTPANELVISGGCYQTGLCPNQDVWALDIFHREWRYLSRGPSPRQFGSLANALPSMANASLDIRQTVVLWGGLETSKQVIRVDEASPLEVGVLDVRNRNWSRELATNDSTETIGRRFGSNMVVVGDGSTGNEFRYFIFGGADRDGTPVAGGLLLSFNYLQTAKLAASRAARVEGHLYVHGIMMWITFGVLFPVGVVIARYIRTQSFSSKWFILHGTTQTIGFLLAWVGLGFGIVGARDKPVHTHAILGSIIMTLVTIQVLSGTPCVRPNPNAGVKRQLWNIAHHAIGWLTFALGLLNCIIGMILLVLPVGTWISMLAAISTLVAVIVVFEIRRFSRRDHKASRYVEEPSPLASEVGKAVHP